MIDREKRTTLKTMSVAAAATLVPAVAVGYKRSNESLSSSGIEITIENSSPLSPGTLTVTNPSSQAVTLKHVNPGLVRSKGQIFDINALLSREHVIIDAGESRRFAIHAASTHVKETPIPGGEMAPDLITVATRYDSAYGERITKTRRLLLS